MCINGKQGAIGLTLISLTNLDLKIKLNNHKKTRTIKN